jgi:hypothetical protein
MAESDLGRMIGEHMRADDNELDPRLEGYAHGEIGDEERAALEAEAARNPERARALSLHAPLSGEFRARLQAQSLRSVRTAPRLRRRATTIGVVGALAAAAAIVFFLRPRPEGLPAFAAAIEVGDQEWRGQQQPRRRAAHMDTPVSILLRPERAVSGQVDAALWVRTADATFRSPVAAQRSADGAVRWVGTAGSMASGRTGAMTFIAVVGRAGALPAAESVIAQRGDESWRSFWIALDVRAPSPDRR